MSVKYLALCLFAILIIGVNSQVCTRTVTVFTETFTISGDVIKNRTTNPPVYSVIKNCCPGYYYVNPQEEASSTNCLKLCKIDCKMETCVNNKCVCSDGFIKDTTETVCIPKCELGYNNVNGRCRLESDASSDNDKAESVSRQYNSYNTVFYVSLITIIILLLIIIVIVLIKCKSGARGNNNNVTERRDVYVDMNSARQNPVHFTKNDSVPENAMSGCSEHYLPMDGVHPHDLTDPPQYESIQYSTGATETPCYDYVQTPLPIHLRQAKQVVPPRG